MRYTEFHRPLPPAENCSALQKKMEARIRPALRTRIPHPSRTQRKSHRFRDQAALRAVRVFRDSVRRRRARVCRLETLFSPPPARESTTLGPCRAAALLRNPATAWPVKSLIGSALPAVARARIAEGSPRLRTPQQAFCEARRKQPLGRRPISSWLRFSPPLGSVLVPKNFSRWDNPPAARSQRGKRVLRRFVVRATQPSPHALRSRAPHRIVRCAAARALPARQVLETSRAKQNARAHRRPPRVRQEPNR